MEAIIVLSSAVLLRMTVLRPGDAFELERDVPHAEQYGVDGATYWVARRLA